MLVGVCVAIVAAILVLLAAFVSNPAGAAERPEARDQRSPEMAAALVAEREWIRGLDEAEWYRGLARSIMVDHWIRIGRCEQPGDGFGGIDWQAAGSTSDGYFEGGLGIAASLYRSLSGGRSALSDGPLEQMRVATLAYGIHGPGAWACKA